MIKELDLCVILIINIQLASKERYFSCTVDFGNKSERSSDICLRTIACQIIRKKKYKIQAFIFLMISNQIKNIYEYTRLISNLPIFKF